MKCSGNGIDMKIGLISDTHDRLNENVFDIFKNVDIILHAGDIGKKTILDRLTEIAPVRAVYGNTDIYSIASTLPSRLNLKLEGMNILLTHNIGSIKNFVWKLKRGDYLSPPDIIVYGHTHKPAFQNYMDYYFINPGSAGAPRGGIPASVMLLEISSSKITSHDIVYLKTGAF